MGNRKRKKLSEKKKAGKEVYTLFEKAAAIASKNPEKAHDAIRKARRAAMKVNLRLPKEFKRAFCKHCYHYLLPGKNCRARIRNKIMVYYCKDCKKFTRIPLGKRI